MTSPIVRARARGIAFFSWSVPVVCASVWDGQRMRGNDVRYRQARRHTDTHISSSGNAHARSRS